MKYYETERLSLRTISVEDFDLLKDYFLRNIDFLSPWEPIREDSFYEDSEIFKRLKDEIKNNKNESQLSLYISIKGERKIIGNVTLSSIIRGPFQSCYIGYKLDKNNINKGYITEAVKKVVEIAFDDLKLHRIEGNIMPRNVRSIKVLEKLGFEYEGLSKEYLKINGAWEDHGHYVLLNRSIK